MKAALTEPRLMEMSLTFHLATATWLTQVATHSDLTTFHPIRFPLPDEVPDTVCHIPEFIMGNLTDFVLFCHRFKDDMFEVTTLTFNFTYLLVTLELILLSNFI